MIAANSPGYLALSIAPIAAVVGIIVGWYLNRLGEDRRRKWQLQDDQAKWKRDREDQLHKWSWEIRREVYAALVASGRRVVIVASRKIYTLESGNRLAGVGKEMLDLAQALDQETATIALFGPKEVQDAATKVWDAALAALQVEDEKSRAARVKELTRLLREFVVKARSDLGI